MSSVETIVDAVSYVLIAFVSISLVVSSIMIGVITYISVYERTKEIGILRAMGASKRNISEIFNAETFIIGLLSGLIGVGISYLLIPVINLVLHQFIGDIPLNAALAPTTAITLIIISVILTVIGGLIPAGKAAKRDPVVALRSE
jgi:putative ABC transport system permease protein